MNEEDVLLIREFVEQNSKIVDIQFDPKLAPKLPIDPYSKSPEVAHYFLLVASIDEAWVIGRAENARSLMVYLHDKLDEKLFHITSMSKLRRSILDFKFYRDFGSLKEKIPQIIASVNDFVRRQAKMDLVRYGERFNEPSDFVKEVCKHVVRMGGPLKKKAWIYMRWTVRPYPDLRIYDYFSPSNLFIPLTSDVARVAACLDLVESPKARRLKWRDVEKVTEFGRKLFPKDPIKIDFPFFLLGRWLHGKKLSGRILRETLLRFDDFYKKTGYSVLVKKERKGYSVECPALRGCITQGETEEEALQNMEEAIACYLEAVKKDYREADKNFEVA